MDFINRLVSVAADFGRRLGCALSRDKVRLASELARAEATRRRLLDAIDLLPEGIVILDEERRYVAWNRQYASIYARTADFIVVGNKLEDAVRAGLKRGDYPEAFGREEAWLADRLNRLKVPVPRHEQTLADGRVIMIEDRLMADGSLVSLRVDITEMKQREASFRILFDNNPLPMFVCHAKTWAILAANQAAIEHYGYSEDRLSTMAFCEVHCAVDPEIAELLATKGVASFAGRSFRHVCADGRLIEVEVRVSELPYAGAAAVLLACIDVTEQKMNEFRVLHMARHDYLTNLPNRVFLNERIDAIFRTSEPAALLFLDLDKFKVVNDTLGHGAGDELLQAVSKRLKQCVRKCDVVARLGGDEFAILIEGDVTRAVIAALSTRVLESLRAPFRLGEREVLAGASIGVALAPHDAQNATELIRLSDLAMYAAKAAGRNTFRFFDPSLNDTAVAQATLAVELRHAIKNNELEVHYQPIVTLTSEEVVCREALVRWKHPSKGLIPPSEFIPVAEDAGLIVDLGEFVLRQACLDAASWQNDVRVSVNVSALELNDPKIVDRVQACLEHAGLSASRLQLEVTETAVMENFSTTTALLRQIQAFGVDIAMDDFGTGYSSLSFLRVAPFDKIKIDKSFVRDLSTREGRSVVAAIVQMADALNMKTIAEGVETIEQRDILRSLRCGEAQGYLYGRPLLLRDAGSSQINLAA